MLFFLHIAFSFWLVGICILWLMDKQMQKCVCILCEVFENVVGHFK